MTKLMVKKIKNLCGNFDIIIQNEIPVTIHCQPFLRCYMPTYWRRTDRKVSLGAPQGSESAYNKLPSCCKLILTIPAAFFPPNAFYVVFFVGPRGRAFSGIGLRPLTGWDFGLESRRGHGCVSVVSVVCCPVEVSATGWSLVKRSPTDCGALLCLI
jgi:hypothetical protein